MSWWTAWAGRSFRARDAEALQEIYGAPNWADEPVTVHGAMQLSAFWACVRLISQIIATLPLGIYQKLPTGERISRDDHPLSNLLRNSPNADQTAVEFWEGRVLGMCTWGNGYAQKIRSGNRIISLEHMPATTGVRRLPSGDLEYRFSQYGKEIVLTQDDVFHIRAFGDGENYCGLSPVSHARQTLGLAMATDRAAAQTFSKGMRSKGFFTSPTLLTKEQREQAHKTLVQPFTGNNGKDWGILEAGFDVKTVNITPRDAELILSRKFNVEDICRWFGVPPIMIGHAGDGQTMWGSGVEQIMLAFYKLGLVPYLERIEQRIKKDLMSPADRAAGIYAEFTVEGLLRGDSASQSQQFSSFIQNGIMTPNEARSKKNWPRMDGGDDLLVNSTLIPLKDAGKQKIAVPTGTTVAPPDQAPVETPEPPPPGEPAQ